MKRIGFHPAWRGPGVTTFDAPAHTIWCGMAIFSRASSSRYLIRLCPTTARRVETWIDGRLRQAILAPPGWLEPR